MSSRDKFEDQKGLVDDCEEEQEHGCIAPPKPNKQGISMAAARAISKVVNPNATASVADTPEKSKQ